MILDLIVSGRAKQNFDKVRPRHDSKRMSLLKSISWRIVGTLDTMFISYIVTGSLTMAVSISGVEFITKITLFYFHERMWLKIAKK